MHSFSYGKNAALPKTFQNKHLKNLFNCSKTMTDQVATAGIKMLTSKSFCCPHALQQES